MVVKKKKLSAKKSAPKKAAKKMAKKSKPVAKNKAKKVIKKVAKKVVKKVVKKAVKKPVKKVAKPVAKKVLKQAVVKNIVIKAKSTPQLLLDKSVSVASFVRETPQVITKTRSTVQPSVSRSTMRQSSSNLNVMNDNVITQSIPRKKATTLLGALEFTPYQPKADEEYMNDHQRDHFRKILDAWKQQLMQDVDLTVGHLKEDAVFYADPVDRASQEEGFNLELRTRDRERKLIKKIEQSLDLLNTGEYGFCEDCGSEIGIRRLEARPTAVKCIDCKTFQEIREKQLGG